MKGSSPTAPPAALAQTLEDRLRRKAMEKVNGAATLTALDASLSRKGDPAPTPAPTPPPPSDSPRVFTLGDSYSSGTGIHKSGDDYVGGDCWRDVTTTPGAQFAANVGVPFVNNACKGGEIPDIHQQFEEIKARHPDAVASGFAGSTISFTIGGNDLQTY